MFFQKKDRLLKPNGVAKFFVVAAALVALAAPAFAQSTFTPGAYCTYTQGGWGSVPNGNNPGTILKNNFSTVYPSGLVEVGLSGAGHSMTFTSAVAVEKYLPAGGQAKALTEDFTNPTSNTSGVFGGQVLALQLNVNFNDSVIIGDGMSPTLGDLSFYATNTSLDGKTVRYALDVANFALGGGNLALTIHSDFSIRGNVSGTSNLNDLVSFLNQGFDNCNPPTDWVKEHLMEPGAEEPPDA